MPFYVFPDGQPKPKKKGKRGQDKAAVDAAETSDSHGPSKRPKWVAVTGHCSNRSRSESGQQDEVSALALSNGTAADGASSVPPPAANGAVSAAATA